MKHVYLLRHAKSSSKDTSLHDHDRPLSGRGRRAAKTIARLLGEQGIEPELVLCSSARRARETLDRLEPALGASTVHVEDDLYAASAHACSNGCEELATNNPTAALATLEFAGERFATQAEAPSSACFLVPGRFGRELRLPASNEASGDDDLTLPRCSCRVLQEVFLV